MMVKAFCKCLCYISNCFEKNWFGTNNLWQKEKFIWLICHSATIILMLSAADVSNCVFMLGRVKINKQGVRVAGQWVIIAHILALSVRKISKLCWKGNQSTYSSNISSLDGLFFLYTHPEINTSTSHSIVESFSPFKCPYSSSFLFLKHCDKTSNFYFCHNVFNFI